MAKRFESFREFYPVYLAMHSHRVNRLLHVAGNIIALAVLAWALVGRHWVALLVVPVVANGLAWIGHYRFQRNRPGVLSYPIYGMLGSWAMTCDVLLGRIRLASAPVSARRGPPGRA